MLPRPAPSPLRPRLLAAARPLPPRAGKGDGRGTTGSGALDGASLSSGLNVCPSLDERYSPSHPLTPSLPP